MITHTLVQNIMLAVFGAAVFVTVLATVYRTLQKTLFQGRTAILMALAVSALCIVGMYQFLGMPSDSSVGPETGNQTNVILNYLLLPYVARTVAILLSQLLLFASKILPQEESDVIAKGKASLASEGFFRNSVRRGKPIAFWRDGFIVEVMELDNARKRNKPSKSENDRKEDTTNKAH